jgi:hypothetical protein
MKIITPRRPSKILTLRSLGINWVNDLTSRNRLNLGCVRVVGSGWVVFSGTFILASEKVAPGSNQGVAPETQADCHMDSEDHPLISRMPQLS